MKRSSPPSKLSKKRRNGLGGKPCFCTIVKRGTVKVNHKRKRVTHEKAHGPKARGEWIATLPCAACGVVGYSQPAHVLGCAGMGLKKGPESMAPLCGPRFVIVGLIQRLYQGCHRFFDTSRSEFYVQFPAFNPEIEASRQDAAWRASLPPTQASRT